MHGVLSIERAQREPAGADGARVRGQCGHPQPGEAASARSLPHEPRGNPRRLGHCSESATRRGEGAVPGAGPALAAPVSCGTSSSGSQFGDHFDARLGARLSCQARGALKFLVLGLIGFYRAAISPAIPSSCRFYPTCSAYAQEAVSKWGVRRGLWLALKRFGRCRPGGSYGYDPVP